MSLGNFYIDMYSDSEHICFTHNAQRYTLYGELND
jgi:hypothetical protein